MAPVGHYLRLARRYSPEASTRVLDLTAALAASRPAGVREICPAPGSVYVEWDDARLPSDVALAWIDRVVREPAGPSPAPRTVEVTVRYGGEDTDEVAALTGLAPDEIARIHAAATYRVCSTATAGQPIMGGTDPRLETPRRRVPRFQVRPRSVAVAGPLSTVYPLAIPGGWNMIGTALVNVFDPHRDDPFTFRLGDLVRHVPGDGPEPPVPARRLLLPAAPALPALRVEDAGALDLVVDGGRLNQAHHGLAQAGPLDAGAARLANALCGNPAGTPCIESTLAGPTLTALRDVVVGMAGRGCVLEVDGERVGPETVAVRRGAVLRVRPSGGGARGYLAVAGGIEAEAVLGSVSVDRHALLGRPLEAGDVLGVAAATTPAAHVSAAVEPLARSLVVRLHRGPQWSRAAEQALEAGTFTVATGDRMGVRLAGPAIPGGEILSESPPPGAVQVPPSGEPIILLADRMRSAGYDKPAVVHPADLAAVAQLVTGDAIRFAIVGDHPVAWERDLT